MANQKMLTPSQVKDKFKAQGTTVAAWAKSHGYRPHAVYQVLNGLTKANHGKAHEIAVALGIKPQPDRQAA